MLGLFVAVFVQIWAQMNFPGKRVKSVFKYSKYLLSSQKLVKS